MANRFVTLEGADQAIANLHALGRQGAIALRQATNDTARYGRTLLVRSVVGSLNLKPAYVRERVDLQLAQGGNLQARIITKKRDVLLSRFGARQVYKTGKGSRSKNRRKKPAGISVQVKPGGDRVVLDGAFFVTFKNGVRAIAEREYESGKGYTGRRYAGKDGKKKGNLAINVLYGPSVYQHFKLKLPEISRELGTKFVAEATRQYERRLPK